jgi:hypothetical protein
MGATGLTQLNTTSIKSKTIKPNKMDCNKWNNAKANNVGREKFKPNALSITVDNNVTRKAATKLAQSYPHQPGMHRRNGWTNQLDVLNMNCAIENGGFTCMACIQKRNNNTPFNTPATVLTIKARILCNNIAYP